MKKTKKLLSVILAAGMLGSLALPVFAAQDNAAITKEENVYAVLQTDGSVKSETVSDHLFCADGLAAVQDVSLLANIENIESDVPFTQKDTQLQWNTADTDVYYSGTTDKTMPVTAKIQYTLDGVQAPAEELTGKSGHLLITIQLTNNETETQIINGAERTVCTPFVTMVGTLLETENYTQITAAHGTVKTDGSNAAVGFVCLPGVRESLQGLLPGQLSKLDDYLLDTVTIEADVTNFSAPSIMFACATDASALNEVDGFAELGDMSASLNQLTQAVSGLLDGTQQLASGAANLNAGVAKLTAGAASLDSNLQQLVSNNAALNAGAAQMFDAVLAGAAMQLNAALAAKGMQPVTLTRDNFNTVLDSITGSIYQQVHDGVDAVVRAGATQTIKRTVAAQVMAISVDGADPADKDTLQTLVQSILQDEAKVAALDSAIANTGDNAALNQAVQAALTQQESTINAMVTAAVEAQWADVNSQANQSLQAQLTANGADEITALQQQLNSAQSFVASVAGYTGAAAQLQSAGSGVLYSGAKELKAGADTLAAGAAKLHDGMVTFNTEGVSKLTGAVDTENLGTLQQVVEAMQTKLENHTSFTGAPNKAQCSVKFIMKTEAAHAAEKTEAAQQTAAEQPEKPNFWQRILNLFGIGA